MHFYRVKDRQREKNNREREKVERARMRFVRSFSPVEEERNTREEGNGE